MLRLMSEFPSSKTEYSIGCISHILPIHSFMDEAAGIGNMSELTGALLASAQLLPFHSNKDLPVNLVPVIWCYCEIALLIRKAVVQTHLFLGCGILFLTKTLRLPTLVFLKEKVLTTWLLGNNPSPIEFSRTHLQKGLYRCSRMQWAPG